MRGEESEKANWYSDSFGVYLGDPFRSGQLCEPEPRWRWGRYLSRLLCLERQRKVGGERQRSTGRVPEQSTHLPVQFGHKQQTDGSRRQ